MNEIYNKLTEKLKQYEKVVIMTHKNPDLDGLSSAICLQDIIKSFEKEVYIYLNKDLTNNSVSNMFNKLEEKNIIINSIDIENYKTIIDSSTLLLIIDVNKISLLENSDLLEYTDNIIVIDHHIRPNDYVKNTILTYVNSGLSSIAEFITNYIKYLDKDINPVIATTLLAAIEIDTNSFNIKTSEDTYQSAAYLMKLGADNVEKQEILKENKDEYFKRQDLIKNSFIINPNTALCVFDNDIYKKEELAITAEELLQFEDVKVSFVIGKTSEEKISISARSLGNIDVEEIMNKMGGGGHLTEAAAEIVSTNINEVKKNLIKIINEVIK